MSKSAFKAFKGIDGVATWVSGTTYPIGEIREKDLIFYKSKVITSTSFILNEWDLVGESNTGGANGLTKIGTNVELGGTLTGDTTVDTGNYAFAIGNGITILDGVVNHDKVLITNRILLYDLPASGTTSQILTRDSSSGLIEYVNKESLDTTPSAPTNSIQFNNNNVFSGSSTFTYSGSTQSVTIGGRYNIADSGKYSFGQGRNVIASGVYSHAEGYYTRACDFSSHAEGRWTYACGEASHSEGKYSKAVAACSHAEGNSTGAYGDASHAEGRSTKSCGIASHAEGQSTCSIGTYSHSEGNISRACGHTSHAEGHSTGAYGDYSHSEGNVTKACSCASHTEGANTKASGLTAHAEGSITSAWGTASHSQNKYTCATGDYSHAGGLGVSTIQNICAFGIASFIHSTNTGAQITGHGTIANDSAILGGRNHNIESGNCRAAIIGGDSIKLTGTTYIDTTAVGNLAIMDTPSVGGASDVLVWDVSDKIVKKVTQASLGGSTSAINGLSINNSGDVVLGGVLTGDTRVDTGGYGLSLGTCQALSTGINSLAIGGGYFTYCTSASGNDSFAGGSASSATTLSSFAFGYHNVASGRYSVSLGGSNNIASGTGSFSTGSNTSAGGYYANSQGINVDAIGNYSHASGKGFGTKHLYSCGFASFNHSENDTNGVSGDGSNGRSSAILGGLNHNIESGNTNAAIIGGNLIKLTGTTYVDTTAVGNLAIMDSPTSSNSTEILARNIGTGIVEKTTLVSTSGLTDSTSIAFDFESKPFGIKTLTTTNTSITVTLSNIIAGANQILSVNKNTASDVTITLAGGGLAFYGYDGADYNTTPDVILSGTTGNIYDISFLARSATEIGVIVGYDGN